MWGDAKIEFIALLPEIGSLLNQAYSRRKIYAALSGQNKISMSYRRFCELVISSFPERARKPKQNEITLAEEKKPGAVSLPKQDKPDAKPFGKREPGQRYNKNI